MKTLLITALSFFSFLPFSGDETDTKRRILELAETSFKLIEESDKFFSETNAEESIIISKILNNESLSSTDIAILKNNKRFEKFISIIHNNDRVFSELLEETNWTANRLTKEILNVKSSMGCHPLFAKCTQDAWDKFYGTYCSSGGGSSSWFNSLILSCSLKRAQTLTNDLLTCERVYCSGSGTPTGPEGDFQDPDSY